ncbi:MAG: glycosyltransferase family 4 protein [Verrucomicrobiota bacterium]|nr:glycosyltransferase family 4 protein [Verrucomicrobiota bacterium]
MPVVKRRMLWVHETMGRMAGAEQNILVTAPHLAGRFEHGLLYWRTSGRDEELFCELFPDRRQVEFDAPDDRVEAEVKQFLREFRPDIIYVHKCMSNGLLTALLDSGVPLVRMQHDHDIYCMRSYKYFPWSRKICTRRAGPGCIFPCMAFVARDRGKGPLGLRWVSYRRQMRHLALNRRCNAVFAVTRYMREELIRQGFAPERIHIFPPVPLPKEPLVESRFSDRNLVVYAGQIIRGKGVDCLIRAMAMVDVPYELVILGSGSHLEYCQALVRELGLEARVRFPGFVSQAQLAEIYADASVVAVPSVWPEPIATVGLEVMRYGLPVVGFDAGGISDWLKDGETGYLIPWKDEERMADRIRFLLEHKDVARRLGSQGRAFVNRVYHFEEYLERLTNTMVSLSGPTDAREGIGDESIR